MNKTDQSRRQLLRSIVAVALAGPAAITEAQANPLLWLLRTAAYGKIARVTARTLARASAVASMANVTSHALNHATLSGVLGRSLTELSDSSEIEVWKTGELRTLYLQIPPLQDTVGGQMTVYRTNLSNNTVDLLLSWPVTVVASNDYARLKIPLQTSTERGLFRFSAEIGNSRRLLRVRDTSPVLLL